MAALRLILIPALLLATAACSGNTQADDDGGGDDSFGDEGGGGTGDEGTGDEGGGDEGGGDEGGGDEGGGDEGGGDDGSTLDRLEEDQQAFQDLLEGTGDPELVITEVANRSGWPLPSPEGGYWFACLCPGSGWQLAGDHDDWAGAPMNETGELDWIEVQIPSPTDSLYKFTDGADTWIPDPLARRYEYDDFGEVSMVEASRAHLERWVDQSSGGLAPRELRVWVPEGGVFTHAVYAHDGQNLFDPDAIWGGWQLQASLPDEMLVVGIDNTGDRMEEYTHVTDELYGDVYGGQGDAYADFVQDHVRPLIEAEFGVPEKVAVMGSSLGGLISFHISDRHEGAWDMAITMSGTMGWGSIELNNPTMIERYAEGGHRDTALYVDSGGSGSCADSDGDGIDDDGDDNDNYCVNLQLRDVLEAKGYVWDTDLWHWHEPGASHNEAEWAARVWRPLAVFAEL